MESISLTGQIGAAVGLSLGVSQIAGSCVILTQIVKGIINIAKAGYFAARLTEFKLSEKKFTHLATDSEEFLNYKSLLNGTEVEFRNSLRDLKQNLNRVVASIICLCPVVGLMAASTYLSFTDSTIANGSKAEMRIATLAKLLIMGGPLGLFSRLIAQKIYPLSKEAKLNKQKEINPVMNIFLAYNEKKIEEYLPQGVHLFNLKPQANHQNNKIRVDRGDGKKHEISCHYENIANDSASKTMVIFHGNEMVGSDMRTYSEEYKKQGWNVLRVTMGGYPQSDEEVETTESTTIQDVNAVLQHLKKLGVNEIGVHGYSIGGTLATYAMKLEPELVKVGVLDRTLNNGPGVIANIFTNIIINESEKYSPLAKKILSIIPCSIIWGIAEGALNPGYEVPGVPGVFTDGLNNIEKVKNFENKLVVIGGRKDNLMGIKPIDFQQNSPSHQKALSYERNFSNEIAEAHAAAHPKAESFHHIEEEGYHVGNLKKETWGMINDVLNSQWQPAVA